MPIKVTRIVVGKGKTTKPSNTEEWIKSYFEMEAEIPETFTRETIEETKLQLESMINQWLETAPIPQFNPDELLKHEWKGKKKPDGTGYEKGTCAWGWDFPDKFNKETINVLKKGPVQLDQYEFTFTGTLVQAKKVK